MIVQLCIPGHPPARCNGFTHELHVDLTRTPGSSDPRTPGRSRHEPFTVTRPPDRLTPLLAHTAASGTLLDEVAVRLWRPDDHGADRPWLTYRLSRVIVTRVFASADDGPPRETVTFDYGSITWAYEAGDSPTVAGWDVHPLGDS